MKKRFAIGGIAVLILAVLVSILMRKKETPEYAWSMDVACDYSVALSLEEMLEEADYVVAGSYKEFDSSWNMARDPENVRLEDAEYDIEGHLYRFEVEEVLKGDMAEGDILVNHKYSSVFPVRSAKTNEEGEVEVRNPLYIEPELGGRYLLFLSYNADFDHYYGLVEPFSVKCMEDGTAKLQSNLIGQTEAFTQDGLFNNEERIQIRVEAMTIEDTISGQSLEELYREIREYSGQEQ